MKKIRIISEFDLDILTEEEAKQVDKQVWKFAEKNNPIHEVTLRILGFPNRYLKFYMARSFTTKKLMWLNKNWK